MSTKIIGNQIDASTRAIMEALQLTEQLNLPALNQTAVTAAVFRAGRLICSVTDNASIMARVEASI